MRWFALSILLLFAGCRLDISELPLSNNQTPPSPRLQFLGVTGFLLRWRDEGLLFDPFFSRPAFPELFWMTPDTKEIDARMPEAADVTMLLVGHAHYDHLLDVAWVMRRHTLAAKIYGSSTAGHILRAELPADRIVNAESKMARLLRGVESSRTVERKDGWFYSKNRGFRAMPVQSNHAPNFTGLDPAKGSWTYDLNALPKLAWNWREGQTLAWLVDLLDSEGRTVYRMHYQDSASDAPYGFPPDVGDNKRIDVVFLPVASWSNVEGYPQRLLNLTRPRLVVLSHWEDFFGGSPDDPKILRAERHESTMIQITRDNVPKGTEIVMPRPFSYIALPAPEGH